MNTFSIVLSSTSSAPTWVTTLYIISMIFALISIIGGAMAMTKNWSKGWSHRGWHKQAFWLYATIAGGPMIFIFLVINIALLKTVANGPQGVTVLDNLRIFDYISHDWLVTSGLLITAGIICLFPLHRRWVTPGH